MHASVNQLTSAHVASPCLGQPHQYTIPYQGYTTHKHKLEISIHKINLLQTKLGAFKKTSQSFTNEQHPL